MALNDAPVESSVSRRDIETRFLPDRLRQFLSIDASDRDELLSLMRFRLRSMHPLVMYRLLALSIAVIIIGSNLHAGTSLSSEWQFILIASIHIVLSAVVAPWLLRRTDAINYLAIALDCAICVLLLSVTFGWSGPFWLYSISAVFWPAHRLSLKGALIAVSMFDLMVLLTNASSIRAAVDDGFGGDLVARMLTVYVVAGAISLTTQASAKMRLLAAESERNRIARDLHDGVGKTMGGISMEARSLEHWIDRDPNEAQRRAHIVARISERAANDVREVIRGLRRSEATDYLFPSIQTIVDAWSIEHSISVGLQHNGPDRHISILLHAEIIRMLTELLTNVGRHAGASNVWVRVTLSTAGATLAVRDDGHGFVVESVDPWADDGHFGLMGTRERVLLLGGRFQLVSSPSTGTEVTIDVPLAARAERAVTALR